MLAKQILIPLIIFSPLLAEIRRRDLQITADV